MVSFPPPGCQVHPEVCSHWPLRGRTVWTVNAGLASGQEGTTGQKGHSQCDSALKPQIRVREAEGGPDSWLSGNIPAPARALTPFWKQNYAQA